MKKLLVFAVAILMAAPAFAAVQNVKVSGNVTETYLNRQNFDFGQNSDNKFQQSVFISQATLRVDADLSDNVSSTVALINERAWGNEVNSDSSNNFSTSSATDVQLYLAYVTMREFLYSPLTLTIGRQAFAFGNSFVFDATGTNNNATGALGGIAGDLTMRTALDAIRATLDYKPLTIDVFYGVVSQGNVLGRGVKRDGISVSGINANYQLGDAMNTVLEAYIFAKRAEKGVSVAGGSPSNFNIHKGDNLYVPGLRASTNPIKGLNVQIEGALQGGNSQVVGDNASSTSTHKRAYAMQAMASYDLSNVEEKLAKYKPTVSASWTYVSGDKKDETNRNSNRAWDPMFENQGGGTIYNSIFNLTNMMITNLTLTVTPLQDVTTSLSWNNLMLAQKLTAGTGDLMVMPDATTVTQSVAGDKRGLGNEFDANVAYNYTEDVKFGLNLGWFVPGSAFASTNRKDASQALASVSVNY